MLPTLPLLPELNCIWNLPAGPDSSLYVLASMLFPDAAPLLRWMSTYLPDAALRKQLQVCITVHVGCMRAKCFQS